jgi:hypothetical protein
VGPNGNVFVIRTGEAFDSSLLDDSWHDHDEELHLTQAQIYEYDVRNGNFIRAYVTGNDHELLFPTGFDFAPGWDVDCNFNLIPDACDIASGSSQDADESQTPDECEIDCNGNGKLDRLDLIPFGASRDCNANLTPDECDLASGTSGDCTSDGVPDECQPNCNGNASADVCEIAAGASRDCNGNATPDECDAIVDLESNPGWIVGAAGDTASGGVWVRVNPVGTDAQPEYDVTPGAGTTCYVTGQGSVGGLLGAADVDGGATTLTTTAIDLTAEPDPHLGYWRTRVRTCSACASRTMAARAGSTWRRWGRAGPRLRAAGFSTAFASRISSRRPRTCGCASWPQTPWACPTSKRRSTISWSSRSAARRLPPATTASAVRSTCAHSPGTART